jgi:hypothetical protein
MRNRRRTLLVLPFTVFAFAAAVAAAHADAGGGPGGTAGSPGNQLRPRLVAVATTSDVESVPLRRHGLRPYHRLSPQNVCVRRASRPRRTRLSA